jgi:hypothetical protein
LVIQNLDRSNSLNFKLWGNWLSIVL